MPRQCIAAGCDGVGGERLQPSQLSKGCCDKKDPLRSREVHNLDSPFLHPLLCSSHYMEDCFIIKDVHFHYGLGRDCQLSRTLPAAVRMIFAR